MLNVLARADDLVAYLLQRVHASYEEAGAKRVQVDIPSMREVVTRPPEWLPRYLDLVQKLRANPAVAREILQTAELACFEALLGGRAHLADAFDHLFTPEHRYLLNVAVRCLEAIVGPATADPVRPILELNFARTGRHADRTASKAASREPEQAERAKPTRRPGVLTAAPAQVGACPLSEPTPTSVPARRGPPPSAHSRIQVLETYLH